MRGRFPGAGATEAAVGLRLLLFRPMGCQSLVPSESVDSDRVLRCVECWGGDTSVRLRNQQAQPGLDNPGRFGVTGGVWK